MNGKDYRIHLIRKNNADLYKIPGTSNSKRVWNDLVPRSQNSDIHEHVKLDIALKIMRKGMVFISEAEEKKTGKIRDIVCLDTNQKFEPETQENNYKKRLLNEDDDVSVIRVFSDGSTTNYEINESY